MLDLGYQLGDIGRINVADMLRRSAAKFPNRTAIADPSKELTYGALDADANRVARSLLDRGIARGAFVALMAGSRVETLMAYTACARAGLIALPVNPALAGAELEHIFGETRPRAIIATPDLVPSLRSVGEATGSLDQMYLVGEPPPDAGGADDRVRPFSDLLAADADEVYVSTEDREPVQCLYTSGTTALPKGVLTSHLAATFASISVAHSLRMTDQDVGLAPLPLHHVAGVNAIAMTHILVGASLHLMSGWDARYAAAAVERLGVTQLVLTGPMWSELVMRAREIGADLSSLKMCVVGMANLVDERAEELRELAPHADIILGSGMTEFASWQVAQTPEDQRTKGASWGRPTLMTEVAIMDLDGSFLPPGEVGEIVYRGPSAMNGYLGQPEATAQLCRDGWFRTGDMGYLDDDHVLWFVDRLKDMIKTGGENVASLEVTDALYAHPAVADCAVIGLPHERWAEAVTAFISVYEDATVSEEELIEHCRTRLARFKVPKRIVFVDEFPRTGSGKIQKRKLREQYVALYAERSGV